MVLHDTNGRNVKVEQVGYREKTSNFYYAIFCPKTNPQLLEKSILPLNRQKGLCGQLVAQKSKPS